MKKIRASQKNEDFSTNTANLGSRIFQRDFICSNYHNLSEGKKKYWSSGSGLADKMNAEKILQLRKQLSMTYKLYSKLRRKICWRSLMDKEFGNTTERMIKRNRKNRKVFVAHCVTVIRNGAKQHQCFTFWAIAFSNINSSSDSIFLLQIDHVNNKSRIFVVPDKRDDWDLRLICKIISKISAWSLAMEHLVGDVIGEVHGGTEKKRGQIFLIFFCFHLQTKLIWKVIKIAPTMSKVGNNKFIQTIKFITLVNILDYRTKLNIISYQHYIVLYRIVSSHIISTISDHVISYHTIAYHIISHHIMSDHIIQYHIKKYVVWTFLKNSWIL